jgi:PKD repeat protein
MKSKNVIWIMAGVLLLSLCVSGVSAAPTAAYTASPLTGDAPLTVSFTDASYGGPAGWAWYFGDETYSGTWTGFQPNQGFTPITGNWDGNVNHKSKVGSFKDGTFYLDYDGNFRWDGIGPDRQYTYGQTGDIPVSGDWNKDGQTEVGIFRPATNQFFLDYNGNGILEASPTDLQYTFGSGVPVSGDWNGDGYTEIGTLNWTFMLDYDGNGLFNPAIDKVYNYAPIGVPVSGDWNNDGKTEIGTFASQIFSLDINGNGVWDGGVTDKQYTYSSGSNQPACGDWNGDGYTDLGTFYNGVFALDWNYDHAFDGSDWTPAWATNSWAGRDSLSVVALPDGSIVLMGGNTGVPGRLFINDVWISADDGATWTQQTSSAPWSGRMSHSSVVMPNGDIVLMGGWDGSGTPLKNDVWLSTDKGVTWTQQTPNAGWTPREGQSTVVMPNGHIVLMGGSDSGGATHDVWMSNNEGVSWTQQTANAWWSARYGQSSVVMPNGDIVLMGGSDDPYTRNNDVWRSTDEGVSWTYVNLYADWFKREGQGSVVMPDGSIVLVGGSYQNDVWRSTDSGVTWSQVNTGADWTGRYYPSIVETPDGSIVLTGGETSGTQVKMGDTWRFNPAGSTVQNPSPHTYDIPGIYSVALQVYDSTGYSNVLQHNYITVTPSLTVTSIYPNAGENTGMISITDLSGNGFEGGTTVRLTRAGESDLLPTSFAFVSPEKLTCDFVLIGAATGHWDVVVTNPGPGGETATLANGFTVTSPTPVPIASFTYDASNMLTVQFTDTSTGGTHSRLWDFGDGFTSTLNPETHTYSSPGTYQVTLTATYSGPSYSDSEIKQVSVAQIARPVAKDDTHVGVLAHPNEETKSASLNPVPANFEVKMTRADESFTTPAKPGYVVAKHALRRNGDGPTDLYFVDSDGNVESLGTTHSLPLNVVMEAEDPYSETNGVTSVGTGGGGVGLGALALIPKCSGSCSNNYALLIDGGKSPEDNHIRYWNDISFMYQTLTKVYGYPKGNIKVLMSDGTADSPADRHISTVGGVAQKDNSPRDLDSDGTDESTLSHIDSATKAHVTGALSDLGSGRATSDNLFIFTTGHGAEDTAFTSGTGHVIYNLWNGDTIKDSEFANALPSSFGNITIVMEQCYGGGFIDDIIPAGYSDTTQKRLIHTAASSTESSYGNGFSNVWTRGMAMITDNRVATNEAEVSPYGNNDGQVAMSEICSFATAADPAATSSLANHEHPQCQKSTNAFNSNGFLISRGWITSPSVVVSSPNALDTWSRGSARYITWNSKSITNVKIELYNSSAGGHYYTLIAQTAAAAGKWSWNIPSYTATGTQIYKVRVSDTSNANTNDLSDQYLTIQSVSSGTLTLTLLPTVGGPGDNGATGATIYLDGDSLGAVTSKSSVPAGTHSITVKKDGWLDQTKGYTQLSTSTPVSFTLEQIGPNERSGLPNSAEDAGRMIITSNIAEAQVWIDGVLEGTTPYEQAVIPGTDWTEYPHKYAVTVKSTGYKPVTKDVEVGKGWQTNENFDLTPEYTFTGFDAPVDMKEVINTAKAGSNIPVKWKLLYNGDPVSLGSKFTLTIQSVSPVEYCGATIDELETFDAPVAVSTISYLGNGNWHYNWKTAKTDSGKCMKVYLLYDNTLTSPYAIFKLK